MIPISVKRVCIPEQPALRACWGGGRELCLPRIGMLQAPSCRRGPHPGGSGKYCVGQCRCRSGRAGPRTLPGAFEKLSTGSSGRSAKQLQGQCGGCPREGERKPWGAGSPPAPPMFLGFVWPVIAWCTAGCGGSAGRLAGDTALIWRVHAGGRRDRVPAPGSTVHCAPRLPLRSSPVASACSQNGELWPQQPSPAACQCASSEWQGHSEGACEALLFSPVRCHSCPREP